jgi:uncharacterized protein with PQ loop repeat
MINFILAIIAAIVFAVSGICQVLRMRKTRSSRDVSLLFTGFMALGIICTLLLVVNTNGNPWLLFERTIGVVLSVVVFLVTAYYRMKNRNQLSKEQIRIVLEMEIDEKLGIVYNATAYECQGLKQETLACVTESPSPRSAICALLNKIYTRKKI